MGKRKDLTGQKIGRLTVIGPYGKKGTFKTWNCQCECGNTTIVITGSLNNGHTQSCGCLRIEKTIQRSTKHGYSIPEKEHPLYFVWSAICQRCTNPKNKRFKDYGARGITICHEWRNNPGKFINYGKQYTLLFMERQKRSKNGRK